MTKIHGLEKKLSSLERSLVPGDEITPSEVQSLKAELNGIKKHRKIRPVAIEIIKLRMSLAKKEQSAV
jgi:hypothetical protein